MSKKRALITGISGQDGSYLAELLLEKGYEVHGIIRRVAQGDSAQRLWRLKGVQDRLVLHSGSIDNFASFYRIFTRVQPDEVYHLAAQSFVSYSFEDEFSTVTTNVEGTMFALAALREVCPKSKFYFAATSEMFGKVRCTPQNEDTPFYPRSPYGISKVTGFDMTRNYRESYDLFACSGILFNHESPRRGQEFVTRKITRAVAAIKHGKQEKLLLGNLEPKRDWGYAKDYVAAMWLMLQADEPQDYVVSTGVTHSVQYFCQRAFEVVGLDWRDYVELDSQFQRPAEVYTLIGDSSRIRQNLGWDTTVDLDQLIEMMVRADMDSCS